MSILETVYMLSYLGLVLVLLYRYLVSECFLLLDCAGFVNVFFCLFLLKTRSSSQMESLLECFAITDGKCHPDCLKANNEQEDYGILSNLES